MKQHWDSSEEENSAQFLEASALVGEDDEDMEPRSTIQPRKARVTELRRRIEERLDSKRIDLEFEYDVYDEMTDSLQ